MAHLAAVALCTPEAEEAWGTCQRTAGRLVCTFYHLQLGFVKLKDSIWTFMTRRSHTCITQRKTNVN